MESPALTEEQWNRVQEIFCGALELPPAEQAAMVGRTTAGDPVVRAEVESLLRADSVGDADVVSAIGLEAKVLLRDSQILGSRLGDYRVIREIGQGGMGAVYLAERDDQHYRKQVAIKVVKRGMDTAEVLGRFRSERQILANLDHPYIARLIDGGSTADGRPFFVMDFVQGQPIDAYCRNQNLDVRARLRLFLRVCEAVSEAHRNLIVHRDLKPGNILVTSDGVPKLLDFGVARLLDPAMDSSYPATAVFAGLLTPEYASPEQVRGLPATTAIDIYSLGAVLYELLTGVRAQPLANRSPVEVDRVVCQSEVTRPSAAAPPRIRRQLVGDLDNIVLMAMRKERDRRYQSVDQMAEDIRRHLAGRPVVARRGSLRYRAWKYVRRHRLAIAAACLIAGSLITGTAVALSEARQAQSARRIAESQKQAAERERTRAEAEAFAAKTERDRSERRLAEMVELADRSLYDMDSAIERLPGATEARQRIVAGTLQFLENLSRDAGPDDRLRYVLSVAYSKVADSQGYPMRPNLGDRAGAMANYHKAADWIAPLLAKEPENPQYLLQFVHVQLQMGTGTVLNWEAQRADAIRVLRTALPSAAKLARIRPRDPEYRIPEGDLYSELSRALGPTDPPRSLEYSRKQVQAMLSAAESLPANREVKLALATAYSQLGQALHAQAGLSYTAPVESYRRSIALREEAVTANPTDAVARRGLMISYANLAATLYTPRAPSAGDVSGAAVYYGKAVAIARELAAADPNDQLAQYDLANALLRYGWLEPSPSQREASLATLRQAEEIFSRLMAADPKSISTARSMSLAQEYTGNRLRDLGRLPEAVAAYHRSLDLVVRFLAVNPKEINLGAQALSSEMALSKTLAMQGDRSAIETARNAIARAQRSNSAPDQDRARSQLAAAYGQPWIGLPDARRLRFRWRRRTPGHGRVESPRCGGRQEHHRNGTCRGRRIVACLRRSLALAFRQWRHHFDKISPVEALTKAR
jgi:tetratricopeptide (TPR) repeat protein